MKDFLPIVLGSDENAYGCARLIHEAYGIKSLLLCKTRLRPTKYTNICNLKEIPDFDVPEVFIKELLNILRSAEGEYEKCVVVPCSDYYVYLVSENYDKFEGRVANKFISTELISRLETKDSFYALCEEYGLDYPKTLVIEKDDRLTVDIESKIAFPLVMKPENSNASDYLNCHFEGKKKVYFLDTMEEYLTVVKSMNTTDYNGKLIVQEYIKGDDSAGRVVNSYSDRNGKVRVSVLGQPVLEEYSPNFLGNYAAIISRNDKSITDRIADFLEKIGYVGYSNFDMKYDSERGKYMLFEINPRLGRSSFFVYGAGINVLKVMIDDVVYGKEPNEVTEHKVCLWTAVPRMVLMKYVKNKELKKEIKKLYPKKVRTIFYDKDKNLKRSLIINRHFFSYVKQYAKYYFDKQI